jgi:hypothetical protein
MTLPPLRMAILKGAGQGRRAAQDAIAGTGPDMTRFRTPAHLASWAGRSPLDSQSGKRKGPGKRKRGNRYPGAITGETAASADRTGTREGARYRKLARSRGKAKACVAPGNTQMRVYPATSARSKPTASTSPSAAAPNPAQEEPETLQLPDPRPPQPPQPAHKPRRLLPPARLRTFFRVSV